MEGGGRALVAFVHAGLRAGFHALVVLAFEVGLAGGVVGAGDDAGKEDGTPCEGEKQCKNALCQEEW